ncbi:MAG: hypothetical protein JWN31_2126 [Frankiales bacterium]|nr:hypothetical protein [Frankiales bacterium]
MATKGTRFTRVAAAVVVAAAAATGPMPQPAQAAADQHVSPPLLQSNWYWHKLVASAPVVVADPGEPSLVPAGDLPVSSQDTGTPAKCSIVAFNLLGAREGSTIDKFSVTLTLDSSAVNLMLEAPQIDAGIAQRNWFNGPGGEADTTNAPPIESTQLVPGVWNAAGTAVTFTVNGLAQSWIDDANYGLEVVPHPGYTTPFQVSFLGGTNVKATMTYTPGSPVEDPVVDQPVDSPPAPVAEVPAPPAVTGPLAGVSGTPAVPEVPSTGVPPSVSNPAPSTVTPAAQALPEVSSRPSAALVWSGAALLALLVVMSLILGGEPQSASSARASRLTAVLRSRSRALHARAATA